MAEALSASRALGSIAVLGPGGVGGFLAALLWRRGAEMTCVASEGTAAAIAEGGLRLESRVLGDFVARPRVTTRLEEPVDVLLVCTSAPALEGSLARVEGLDAGALVVPLLNGLDHMALLRERWAGQVAAATIGQVEAKRVGPAHVLHTTPGARIDLSREGVADPARVEALAALLRAIGVSVALHDREVDALWGKLVRLGPLALATAAADRPIGALRGDPEWRGRIVGCVRETAAVAAADGYAADPDEVLRQIDALPPGLGTSLQRAVSAGLPSELDAIGGAILRRAGRHGVECPSVSGLVELVRARSEARGSESNIHRSS